MSTAIESVLFTGKGIVNPSSVVVNTSLLPQTTFQVSGTSTLQGPVNIQGGLLYPPTAMTSNSTVVSGQTYGNGTYTSSWSTADFGAGTTAWNAFTHSIAGNIITAGAVYTAGVSSPYNGATSTTDTNTSTAYLGAYVQIQLPSAIQLFYYTLCGPPQAETRNASIFYVFGSNNGTTWFLVDSRSGQTWSSPQVFNTYYPTGTSAGTAFSYWRLVANTVQGNWQQWGLSQWFLYGPQTPVGPAQYIVGGNVGIGLTNPGATLQVSGNVYASNAIQTNSVVTTNPIPFRNRIINGAMTIWQRNTASISTTAGLYTTADRWCGALGTSGLLLSQWPGPTEALQFPYSLQVTTSTAASGTPLIEQHIENLNIPDFLNGTPVTVSFYAGQSYGTLMPLTVGLYYATVVNNFGTQTLAVSATQNTPTLTAANVYYSLSFTLTSSLGATNGLSLRFTTGTASAVGSTVLLTGVQVEKGSVPTPFEIRPYATELALCQRYYYQLTSPTAAVQGTSAVYAIFGTATGITTTAFWLPIQFPVPMRNPYYTFSNSAVTNFQLLPTGTTTITSVGIQSDSYTPIGATLNFVGTNIVATASYIFRTNNLTGSTVAFFGFSCEL